jgi:hypothetical protein
MDALSIRPWTTGEPEADREAVKTTHRSAAVAVAGSEAGGAATSRVRLPSAS